MEMEDDKRNELLQMDARQMRDVAMFVNSYPTLDVSYELAKGEYTAGAPITIQVSLSKDSDEDMDEPSEDDETVIAPFYPKKKLANWWVVIGEPKTRQLLAIKKVTVHRNLAVRLEFSLPQGTHALKLYVICDSYMGADHDIDLDPLEVAEGEDDDSAVESAWKELDEDEKIKIGGYLEHAKIGYSK